MGLEIICLSPELVMVWIYLRSTYRGGVTMAYRGIMIGGENVDLVSTDRLGPGKI